MNETIDSGINNGIYQGTEIPTTFAERLAHSKQTKFQTASGFIYWAYKQHPIAVNQKQVQRAHDDLAASRGGGIDPNVGGDQSTGASMDDYGDGGEVDYGGGYDGGDSGDTGGDYGTYDQDGNPVDDTTYTDTTDDPNDPNGQQSGSGGSAPGKPASGSSAGSSSKPSASRPAPTAAGPAMSSRQPSTVYNFNIGNGQSRPSTNDVLGQSVYSQNVRGSNTLPAQRGSTLGMGASPNASTMASISALASNPMFLVVGAVALFMLVRK